MIRVEIPVDAMGIDQLLRQTFAHSDEADLVQRLREDGLLTLGVVATDDGGRVIGYVAFSPVEIAGYDTQWVALAPVAVAEAYRRQGIAEQLIYTGLDSLNEFGYQAVVVLGDPAYYSRFGFGHAGEKGLYCRWSDIHSPAFQVYQLADGNLAGIQGEVHYSAHFSKLD